MNDILNVAKNAGLKVFGKVKKVSPEILLGVGSAAIVAGIIFACKKTKEAEEVINEHIEVREIINSVEDGKTFEDDLGNVVTYTASDRKKDIAKLYFKTTKGLLKTYALPIALIGGGFTCIFSGFGILKKRNAQILAACTALSEAFDRYKKQVRDEFGAEKEQEIALGIKEKEVETEVEGKDGKKKVKKTKVKTPSDLANDPYARCFDEYNPNWKKDPFYNKTFLEQVERYANDIRNSRGFIFLNEVYDALGFDLNATGAVTGWVKGMGDDRITFGIDQGLTEAHKAFLRGEEPSIWLTFNVDGVILDYI